MAKLLYPALYRRDPDPIAMLKVPGDVRIRVFSPIARFDTTESVIEI